MKNKFPTKYELRCAGISFTMAHILISTGWFITSLPYDIYDVKNDQDVISLHNAVSEPAYRVKSELGVTCLWISFPLLLIGLFGLKKHASIWYKSTAGEMYVYLFEKAYIVWITIVMIIMPALQLVIVSYDWSFDQVISDPSQSSIVSVPSGYYIQLFLIVFQFEIFDCVSIADGIFMISLWILGLVMVYGAYTNKQNDYNVAWRSYLNGGGVNNVLIFKLIGFCCVISSIIIFLVLLFEFAESGFFSIAGHAKFLLVWIFICKIYIGLRLIYISTKKKYSSLKKIYQQQQETENILNENNVNDHDENYQMNEININTQNND